MRAQIKKKEWWFDGFICMLWKCIYLYMQKRQNNELIEDEMRRGRYSMGLGKKSVNSFGGSR